MNVYDGEFAFDGLAFLDEKQADQLSNVTVSENDILLNITGASIARCCVAPTKVLPARVNQHVSIIRPVADVIDPTFLMHLLTSRICKDRLLQTGEKAGATRQAITKAQLQEFSITFPKSLLDQRRIVAILDEAFEAIATATANAEKNLANARGVFVSQLNKMFESKDDTWQELSLEDVAKEFGRGKSKHRPRNDPKLYEGRYPFIQTGDIRAADRLILEFSQTYNEAGLAQSKLWPKGTICITIAANIAETGILGFDACFPDSVIGLVVNESKAVGAYVEYALQYFKTALQAEGQGSAQANINLATFERRTFPFPCLEKQREIARALDSLAEAVRSLEEVLEAKIMSLTELKQAILAHAFSGQFGPVSSALKAAE